MFDSKIFVNTPTILSIGGGCIFLIGLVVTGTVKVMTKTHITKDEAFEYLVSEKNCHLAQDAINAEIKGLKSTLCAKINGLDGKIDLLITMKDGK